MSDTAVAPEVNNLPPTPWRDQLKQAHEEVRPTPGQPAEKKPEADKSPIGRNERRLLRQNGELKARLAAIEEKLKGGDPAPKGDPKPAEAAEVKTLERPKREAFASDEEHEDAVYEWRKARDAKAADERKANEAAQEAVKTVTGRYMAAMAESVAEIPELKAILESSKDLKDAVIPAVVVTEIVESCAEGGSKLGPLVTAYLIKNPDELKKLEGMTEAGQKRYYYTELEPAAKSSLSKGEGGKPAAAADDKKAPASEKGDATAAAAEAARPRRDTPARLEGGAAPAGPAKSFPDFLARQKAAKQQ